MTFIKCCECGAKLSPEALQLPSGEIYCQDCKKRYNAPPWRPIK